MEIVLFLNLYSGIYILCFTHVRSINLITSHLTLFFWVAIGGANGCGRAFVKKHVIMMDALKFGETIWDDQVVCFGAREEIESSMHCILGRPKS